MYRKRIQHQKIAVQWNLPINVFEIIKFWKLLNCFVHYTIRTIQISQTNNPNNYKSPQMLQVEYFIDLENTVRENRRIKWHKMYIVEGNWCWHNDETLPMSPVLDFAASSGVWATQTLDKRHCLLHTASVYRFWICISISSALGYGVRRTFVIVTSDVLFFLMFVTKIKWLT